MAHMRNHASRHTDGTDDLQSATSSVKGLATAAQIEKLDGVDALADVTGDNPPQGHAASHQNAGDDEVSVAGLSGVLADKQDANKLQGRAITTSVPSDYDVYGWNNGASEFQPRNQHNVPTKLIVCRTFTNAGINTAIDALGSSGGEVYLPEGTYTITGAITIDYNNTTLRGAGKGTILDASAGQQFNVIDVNGKSDCTICDLQIIGKTGETGDNHLIYDAQGHNLVVRGCYFNNADCACIGLSQANSISIHDNEFASSPIGIDVYGVDNRIFGNYFNALTSRSININMGGTAASGVVSGNTFNASAGWYVIADHFTFTGNLTQGGLTECKAYAADWLVITGNIFYEGVDTKDELVIEDCGHVVISNNTFNATAGHAERAVNVINSDYVTLVGNASAGHDTCGIAIDATSSVAGLGLNTLLDTAPTVFSGAGQVAYIRSVVVGQMQTFSVTGINLKSVAQTQLYTVPTGYRLQVKTAEIIVDTITGADGMPTIRFGVDGDEGSFVGAREIDETMNEAGALQSWDCPQDSLAAGQVLEFGVTVAGTSTTHTCTVLVTAYLLEA